MSLSPTQRPATPTTILGVPGYRFGDLQDPDCLASLYERFCEDVRAADPALWRDWEAYRSAPGAPRPPTTVSDLLVAMATHVSRFLTRLFQVQPSVDALAAITRDQDDLFRFKVDFVRRRVLPLVKGGANVDVDAGRREGRREVDWGSGPSPCRRPGRGARHRARRLCRDGHRAGRRRQRDLASRQSQALVRGAGPRSGVSRVADIPVSRNPRLLAACRGSTPAAGPAWSGWSAPRAACAAATASS